jgi:tRNA(Ile)-lysidine synthase
VQHSFATKIVPELERLVAEVAASFPADADEAAGGGLLVALSGGPDSVALLHAARAWSQSTGRPLAAAHLNHRLRGGEADADEVFCRELCGRLGIELHVERRDPRPLARQRGQGLEEAARELRREFFATVLAAHPELAAVATGHHRGDQIETVVMRFFRGTGLDGLAGLRARDGRTIHPLLAVDRSEILAYLSDLGQPYRQDATNISGSATRTRVRRELLPLARAIFGASADVAPARLAELAAAENRFLADLTAAQAERLIESGRLRWPELLELEPVLARRVIRLFATRFWNETTPDAAPATPLPLERGHVEQLLAWLRLGRSGQRLDLPGGLRAVREFAHLRFERGEIGAVTVSRADLFRILVTTEAEPPSSPAVAADDRREPFPAEAGANWKLTVPAQNLRGSLRVRNWRPGDRIVPFGMTGHKKVSDLLQEHRIPRAQRPGALIVEDDSGILWVPGVAQAERTRLLPTTRRAVTIRIVPRLSAPARDRVPRRDDRSLQGKDHETR